MLKSKRTTDSLTHKEVQVIGADGIHVNHNYFTAMTWRADSRRLCLHTNSYKQERGMQFVTFDLETEETRLVHDGPCAGAVISTDDQVFYIAGEGRGIRAIDIKTNEERLICRFPSGIRTRGVLSVTNDSRYIGANIDHGDRNGAGLIDAETGKLEHFIDPQFPKPSTTGHTMVNPVHSHLLFYCHESMINIHRMWLADLNTGEITNIYRQKRLNDGTVVEYVGHEMWEFNGNGMYFIKYIKSPLAPTGVYYTDTRNTAGQFINGDYRYWHVAVSPNGKYVVADTNDQPLTKIVLIDTETRQSKLLCEGKRGGKHPGHPHPSFSPDSRKVCFTFLDENHELRVGVVDIYQ